MHLLRRAAKSMDDQSTGFGYWVPGNTPQKSMKQIRKYFLVEVEVGSRISLSSPTRLTPEIDLGLPKEELNLGKSLQWDSFRQEKNKQPLERGIISPSWTLALLPVSCTNLVQPEKQSG